MSAEIKKEIELEIAHVLFIDIVGYSKLPINQQRDLVERLNEIVRSTDEFQAAQTAGRLIKIPTGDGMALVFYQSPEAPVECALEISRAVKEHSELRLRMGVHSGPVSGVIDVNERPNVAGAGMNMAKRVMDCADAGHILLSKHVAEDLEQYPHWQPLLHDLGECEVKQGAKVIAVNLYTEELGNPALPEKFRKTKEKESATPATEKSIAVLPFENFSEDRAFAFFADGMQDEILNSLAKIADLKVISRTSVMQYRNVQARNLPEIAQTLKVAHVLEGSVQRSANRVRVSAQLINARDDTHVWVEKYDRELTDVFAIQSEIAQAIADQLQAKLSPTEKSAINERPTSDLAAYDLYLQAKETLYTVHINPVRRRENLFKAVEFLDQAVARDPAFLLAYCALSYAHDWIYRLNFDNTETRLALAETSLRAAVRLRPHAGETHLAQAFHFYIGYYNYDRARQELAKAQRTLPNNAQIFALLGLIDRRQGRWEEAIRNLEHAMDLNPRDATQLVELVVLYFFLRKYAEATAVAHCALALQPRSALLRVAQAYAGVAAEANMAPLRAALNTIEAEDPSAAAEVSDVSFNLALWERDPVGAARALANIPREGCFDFNILYLFLLPHAWYEGLLAKLQKDEPAAHSAFMAARAETEKLVLAQPGDALPLSVLAFIDAELDEKQKAMQEGRTACDMLPRTKDAVTGTFLTTNLARIYALTGENDLALKELDVVSKIPYGPSYGQLRLDPWWDSLRGDPRFEQIVASLAPKKP